MAPNTSPSSGNVTPDPSVFEAPLNLPVHPTASRRPADLISVQSQATVYSNEFITSKFENRGADVVVQQDGRYVIQPTVKPFEFRTQRKVPKTGCAQFLLFYAALLTRRFFFLSVA